MRIGIAVTFPAVGFSGGRLHAWLLAVGLAQRDHKVTVVCNARPAFLEQLPAISGSERLQYLKLKFDLLRGPAAPNFDLWIVVQERSLNGRFFQPVLEHIERTGTPLLGLIFETPNWQAAVLEDFDHGQLDGLLVEFGRLGAHLLCSTQTGVSWARSYWPRLPKSNFHWVNPPILAPWFPEEEQRDPRLLAAILRHRSIHKGTDALAELATPDLVGYRIRIVDSLAAGPDFQTYLEALSSKGGPQFEVVGNISEAQKYRLLKTSRALLFPSSFEGFGLPPAEAGYWGTPVVCRSLPVLCEVYGNDLRYAEEGPGSFVEAVRAELDSPADYAPRVSARRVGNWRRWCDEIDSTIRNVASGQTRNGNRPKRSSVLGAMILDQLQNWNQLDTKASLDLPGNSVTVVDFSDEMRDRLSIDLRDQGFDWSDIALLPGNPDENLRLRLLTALERLSKEFVAVLEDLVVFPAERVERVLRAARRHQAAATAVPIRYNFQADGYRHFRTERGELLAAVGLFRRDALIEALRTTNTPGCRQQPILDLSYLLLAKGEHFIPAEEGAERLPPRDRPLLWESLPGGSGSWHRESRRDPLGPVPCSTPDDDQELHILTELRRLGVLLFAESHHRYASRTLINQMLEGLDQVSLFWREHFLPDRPRKTYLLLRNNFPNLSRCFVTRQVLWHFLNVWWLHRVGLPPGPDLPPIRFT